MYSDTVFSSISLSFSHFTWYYSQIEGIRKTVPQGKPSPTGDLLSPTDLSDFRIYSGNLLPLFNRSFCLLPLFSVIPPPFGKPPAKLWQPFWKVNPPPALSSTDLHDDGYDISIGLVMLPHVLTLLRTRLNQTVHFSGGCRHVVHRLGLRVYCRSCPSCASITSEFCLKQSILADTPLELGSVYPF